MPRNQSALNPETKHSSDPSNWEKMLLLLGHVIDSDKKPIINTRTIHNDSGVHTLLLAFYRYGPEDGLHWQLTETRFQGQNSSEITAIELKRSQTLMLGLQIPSIFDDDPDRQTLRLITLADAMIHLKHYNLEDANTAAQDFFDQLEHFLPVDEIQYLTST
jgi:hypothetical protein